MTPEEIRQLAAEQARRDAVARARSRTYARGSAARAAARQKIDDQAFRSLRGRGSVNSRMAALQALVDSVGQRGVTPSEMEMRARMSPEDVRARAAAEPIGRMESFMRGGAQGVSGGFADEAAAHLRAGQDQMASYDSELARSRGRDDAARENYPVTTFLGEMAGSVIPAAGPAAKVLKAGDYVIPRVAAIGAVEGAVHGAGRGEGGAANRAESAAIGTAAGGVMGAASVPAGNAVAGVMRRAGPAMRSLVMDTPLGRGKGAVPVDGRGETSAAWKAPDGLSPLTEVRARAAVQDSLEGARRAGRDVDGKLRAGMKQPYALVDALGENGIRRMNSQVQVDPDVNAKVKEFLVNRQLDQADRIIDGVSDGLRLEKSAKRMKKDLEKHTKKESRENYDAAEAAAGPIDTRKAISILDERLAELGGSYIKGDSVDAMYRDFRDRMTSSNPAKANTGSTQPRPVPYGQQGYVNPDATRVDLSDYKRIKAIKDDVHDAIKGAKDRDKHYLWKIYWEIDKALAENNSLYRTARDTHRENLNVVEQIDNGKKFSRGERAQDVVDEFRSLPVGANKSATVPIDQRQAFRYGYPNDILRNLEKARGMSNSAGVLTSKHFRDVMSELEPVPLAEMMDLGEEATRRLHAGRKGTRWTKTSQLADFARRENEMHETMNRVQFGSQTARNEADKRNVGTIGGNIVDAISSRGLVGASLQGLRRAGTALGDSVNYTSPEVRDEIARILTLKGDDARNAIREILEERPLMTQEQRAMFLAALQGLRGPAAGHLGASMAE